MVFAGDGDEATDGDADIDPGEDLRDFESPSPYNRYGLISVNHHTTLMSPSYIHFPTHTTIIPAKTLRQGQHVHPLHHLQQRECQQQHPQAFTHKHSRPQTVAILRDGTEHASRTDESQEGEDTDAEPADSAGASEIVGVEERDGEEDDLGDGDAVAESDDAVAGTHGEEVRGGTWRRCCCCCCGDESWRDFLSKLVMPRWSSQEGF